MAVNPACDSIGFDSNLDHHHAPMNRRDHPPTSSIMTLQIIVVGAGIAGLCAAVALRQAGHTVQIFEKLRFATETGAALALSPNGVLVLKSLGFDFDRARACPLRAWELVDGMTLSRISIQETSGAADAEFWTIHRVDLHQELLRLARGPGPKWSDGPPVKIQLAAPVSMVDSANGQVFLEDGSIHRADLIVGADGLRSVVRAGVIPDFKSPISTGLSAFRFLLPTETLEKEPNLKELLKTKSPGSTLFADTKDTVNERHFVWYGCRGGEVQNFVGIHPRRPSQGEVRPGDSTPDFKADMIEEFSHFHPGVVQIMELAEDVKCWPLLIHEPLQTWVYDRVLLVGDAAHAMLPFGGQGANQAIEDAGALAVLFKNMPGPKDIPARLSLFENVRRKRATRVQILSRVRVGREKEVEEQLQKYMEPDMVVPNSFAARVAHDSRYDVLKACARELESQSQASSD